MIISVPFCMSGPTSAVPAETDVQNCFVGFRASASGESDIHGWYEKRVAEGTVPYEVVRPSVTLITRYSVIANGNEMRLAARTTRLLTSALPASSPRSKLVAPSQPFGSRSVVPSSSRTRPTTRSALFWQKGGDCLLEATLGGRTKSYQIVSINIINLILNNRHNIDSNDS